MDQNIFIEGEKLYLREYQLSDIKIGYKWLNNQVVTNFQNKGIFPNTYEKQHRYYELTNQSDSDVILAIIDKKSNDYVGNVGLHNINWIHRSAEIGIVIGDQKIWGKGLGKEAWKIATDYGFNKLNLHRIYAYIVEENTSSIKCAEYSGYKKEGYITDFLFKNGKYLNGLFYNKINK